MPNWVAVLQWGIPILLTVLNLILAVFNFRFARQQSKITRQDQFDLRFYDKRRAIFDAVMEFVGTAVKKGNVTQEDLRKLARGTKEAPQLYDDKINGIIQNLYKEGVNEMVWHDIMDKGTSPDHKQIAEAW